MEHTGPRYSNIRMERTYLLGADELQTGRFLRPISADDILFGNTFDRPLRLPWGAGAALKFMKYVLYPFVLFALFINFVQTASLTPPLHTTSNRKRSLGHSPHLCQQCPILNTPISPLRPPNSLRVDLYGMRHRSYEFRFLIMEEMND